MPETLLNNQPISQTPTGEIKDQSTTSQETTSSITPAADQSLLNSKTPEGAPEKYADFTAPEGYELDPAVIAEASPIFKELGLSQPAAQRLVDFYIDKANAAAQAPIKLWEDTQKQWVTEIKADPDLGRRLDSVKANVSKMLDGLGDSKLASEFRTAMDLTGAGNNPAFIRVMDKLASKLTEGTFVKGGGPSQHGQTAPGNRTGLAQAMYPNLQ